MSDRVTNALEVQNIVRECLGWDDRSETLFWVDILGRAIHAYRPATGHHESTAVVG